MPGSLTPLAQRHPSFRPLLHCAQARYRELQGDLLGALEATDAGLALIEPGRHCYFEYLAAGRLRLLDQLGEYDQARSCAREYLAIAVEYAPDRMWFEASYLDALRPYAQRVTIADGESKTLSLKLVTP